jgi:hypothetical protein
MQNPDRTAVSARGDRGRGGTRVDVSLRTTLRERACVVCTVFRFRERQTHRRGQGRSLRQALGALGPAPVAAGRGEGHSTSHPVMFRTDQT